MGEVKLLDCTLRDGGYLNDWNFGHDTLVSVFERMSDAAVDFLEIGFLDDRRTFDINRSIMPDTDSVRKIYGKLERHNTKVLGMIDYGTCSINNISRKEDSFLDGIRVIFKKHLRKDALSFCKQLKEKGYIVFAQLVSVTSYTDEEMLDLIRLANEVEPYAVSMVDTYGLMHQNNLQHYFTLLNNNLNPNISMGYHGHNNFQMAYANSINMMSQKTNRDILVDGTLYGMGKSAGNAPIELLAMWMNDNLGKNYHISQMLEAIDVNIKHLTPAGTWGYSLHYYLSASNDCHPNYVQYLIKKRTLSVKSINEILRRLSGEKKLLYDADYIENLYQEYQMKDVDDVKSYEKLRDKLLGKVVLLLAPGNTIRKEQGKIKKFIEVNNPIVISVNFIDDVFNPQYIFLTNSKRYLQLTTKLSEYNYDVEVIATSNITKTNGEFEYQLRYADLVNMDADVIDNPLFMFLKAAKRIGLKNINLAGFDGYNGKAKGNYISKVMEYNFDKKVADSLNDETKRELRQRKTELDIRFVTSSKYEEA